MEIIQMSFTNWSRKRVFLMAGTILKDWLSQSYDRKVFDASAEFLFHIREEKLLFWDDCGILYLTNSMLVIRCRLILEKEQKSIDGAMKPLRRKMERISKWI